MTPANIDRWIPFLPHLHLIHIPKCHWTVEDPLLNGRENATLHSKHFFLGTKGIIAEMECLQFKLHEEQSMKLKLDTDRNSHLSTSAVTSKKSATNQCQHDWHEVKSCIFKEVYSSLRKNRTLVFPRLFCKYVFQKDHASCQTAKSHIARCFSVLCWMFSKLFKKNRGLIFCNQL